MLYPVWFIYACRVPTTKRAHVYVNDKIVVFKYKF